MSCLAKLRKVTGIALAIAFGPSAVAQIVFQENFESPRVSGFNASEPGEEGEEDIKTLSVPGWVGSKGGFGSSSRALYNEFVYEPKVAPFSTPFGQQGYHILGPNSGLTTAQGATGVFFEAGKTYILKVNAAALNPGEPAQFGAQLLAMNANQGDEAREDLRTPKGQVVESFSDSTTQGDMSAVGKLTYTVPAGSGIIGKEVAIRFFRSYGVVYDNVRLIVGHDFDPSPAFLQPVVGTNGATQTLKWRNPAPTDGASRVLVDLYYGTAPEKLEKVMNGGVNRTSFKVAITDSADRYWRVVVYTKGSKNGPKVRSSLFHFVVEDFDNDGLPDAFELAHTSPPSTTSMVPGADSDNDRLTNFLEYRWNSDPRDKDTDRDTIPDGVELANNPPTNPISGDTDDDGWRDNYETNTGVFVSLTDTGTSPVNRDTDGDGLRDGVETNNPSAYPVKLSDRYEARRYEVGTDPFNPDTDGDGTNDWYEVVASFTDPHVNSTKEKPANGVTYPLAKPDPSDVGSSSGPIKVYIMAGQSNMVGVGYLSKNQHKRGSMIYATQVDGLFSHLVDENGDWLPRNDVHYREVIPKSMNMPLTVGGADGTTRLGPEFGFGHQIGEFHDEPVLLIKAATGNRGLGWDFLPPGSPQREANGITYAGHHESPQKWPTGTTAKEVLFYGGYQYDLCFRDESLWTKTGNESHKTEFNVYDVLTNFDTQFPQWAGRGFEIAGFVWWQGHWDQFSAGIYASVYEENLVRLIDQLRADFNAPEAPFVLGTVGFKPDRNKSSFQHVYNGQKAVSDPIKYPRYAGNLATVDTLPFWRELHESPGTQDFHYNNNCETYTLVGDALARAMIELKVAKEKGPPATLSVSRFSPPSGASDIALDRDLVIVFDQNVTRRSGNIIIKNLTDKTQETISVTDRARVTIEGRVLTIKPRQNFKHAKRYAIGLERGFVNGSRSNRFGGISNDTTWTFTTIRELVTRRILFEDFETPDVSVADSVGDTKHVAPGSNWVMTSSGFGHQLQGVIDKAAGGFKAPNPNRQAYAMRYTNTGLWSAPDVLGVVEPGVTYVVSFSVGQDLETFSDANHSQAYNAKLVAMNPEIDAKKLRENATAPKEDVLFEFGGRAQPGGEFETVSFSVTVDPADPQMASFVGRELALFFTGFGKGANIDNIEISSAFREGPDDGKFAGWKKIYRLPEEASMVADTDGDGIANGIENYFGTDPTRVSPGLKLGRATQTETGSQFTFTHPESASPAGDLSASYRWSPDLSSFYSHGQTVNGSRVTFIKQENTPVRGTTTVIANVTGAKIEQLYVRVVVSQQR